jgi:hypothetical protein
MNHDFTCLDADKLDQDLDVTYALHKIVIPSYCFGCATPFLTAGCA